MTDYKMLDAQTEALLRDEPDALASAANFVALLYHALEDVNWLGIYAYAAPRQPAWRLSACQTCTRFPVTSSATLHPVPRSWCP
jgi:L-methionine (R)-S-oxide reductase